jgi:hypothetical protein
VCSKARKRKKEGKQGKPCELILGEDKRCLATGLNSYSDLNLYSYFDLGIDYPSLSSYSYSGLEIFLFWF